MTTVLQQVTTILRAAAPPDWSVHGLGQAIDAMENLAAMEGTTLYVRPVDETAEPRDTGWYRVNEGFRVSVGCDVDCFDYNGFDPHIYRDWLWAQLLNVRIQNVLPTYQTGFLEDREGRRIIYSFDFTLGIDYCDDNLPATVGSPVFGTAKFGILGDRNET